MRKGGRVVCGGIHMSDIPSFPYAWLWEEREIVSVANLTRHDGVEFLDDRRQGGRAATTTRRYALADANLALADLSAGPVPGRGGADALTGPPASFLGKFLQIKACFLQIFANISLAVLWDFNYLGEEKSLFSTIGVFANF